MTVHAGHDVAEVVQHAAGDHAGGRERQHDAVERLAVGQIERPSRRADPPRAQRAVDVPCLRALQLVPPRRQAVERERALAVAEGHPRFAAAQRLQHDACPPQRQPGVPGHDAATHDAGADRGGRTSRRRIRAAARRASLDAADVGADGAADVVPCAYANGGVQTIAAAVTKPMAARTGNEMREVRMIE